MTTVHEPADWFLIDEGTSADFGGRYVRGKRGNGGDPVPGDVLVVGGDGGRRTRWAVTAISYPYREHHPGDQVAGVWVATVRPVLALVTDPPPAAAQPVMPRAYSPPPAPPRLPSAAFFASHGRRLAPSRSEPDRPEPLGPDKRPF